jgi:hypothetical protein
MANTYVKIATVSVGVLGASTMDFSSIPSTYTDLALKVSARGSLGSFPSLRLTVNGATTNYTSRRLYGDGSAAASDSASGVAYMVQQPIPGLSETASTFGSTEFYLPNYAGSTNKPVSVDSVAENNATATFIMLNTGLWSQTTAISSLSVFLSSGNFVQYSSATLYGISKS